MTSELGVEFRHENGALGEPASELDLPGVMGGGLAVFDCDGDGDLDLYFVNGNRALVGGDPGEAVNRLFVQRDGRYHDGTDASGLGDGGYGMGAAVGDVDRDGDLDVYVTNLGPDRLYLNDGSGRFVDATADFGVDVDGWSTGAAFWDRDGDGWLDLYVVRYVQWAPGVRCKGLFGQPDWCGPRRFAPEHDVLLANQGGRRFLDVSAQVGLTEAPAAGLGVACADLDGDGRTDVFVANDAGPNQLWVHGEEGRLLDLAPALGVALDGDGVPEAGMGVVIAPLSAPDGSAPDGSAPGKLDVLLSHLRGETNTLYRRAEGPGFRDATGESGLGPPSQPFTGFGLAAVDVELDGDLDLVVANGGVNRSEPSPYSDLPLPWRELAEPDHLFLNDGRGRFVPAPDQGGPLCRTVRISRGLAAADLDRDGDLDLVVTSLLEPARILRNDAPRRGHWLALRVLERPGPSGERAEALGASVRVRIGDEEHVRVVARASGYLTSSDGEVHLGLGQRSSYDQVQVIWADGETSSFPGGAVDRRVTLARP